MSEKIEPALSAEGWAVANVEGHGYPLLELSLRGVSRVALPGIIARANALLSDEDPRKITRELVDYLRSAATWVDDDRLRPTVDRFIAALESYLPPESE